MLSVITRSAPGKLFVVGEYSVVEPGRVAIVASVDRRVSVTVTHAESATYDVAVTSDMCSGTVRFVRKNLRLLPIVGGDAAIRRLRHVMSAIEVVQRYALEVGTSVVPINVDITSELHEDGVKLGLGSSGAVTVAAIAAIGAFHGLEPSMEERYRLAMLATARVDPKSSGGDLAASTWEGWVAYSAPNRLEVLGMAERFGVEHTIHAQWPNFSVQSLNPPKNLNFEVGWTGTPSSSPKMVGGMMLQNHKYSTFYRSFLWRSDECVQGCITALRERDTAALLDHIRRFRLLLETADGITQIGIFTDRLNAFCRIAEEAGGTAKPSGSGGGDCGIAVLTDSSPSRLEQLRDRWRSTGIRPLALNLV
ncbi:phosphomevalonate kinase [Nocardia sp. NPDC003482]